MGKFSTNCEKGAKLLQKKSQEFLQETKESMEGDTVAEKIESILPKMASEIMARQILDYYDGAKVEIEITDSENKEQDGVEVCQFSVKIKSNGETENYTIAVGEYQGDDIILGGNFSESIAGESLQNSIDSISEY